MIDSDLCTCECHESPDAVRHIAPCCVRCKFCGAHVMVEMSYHYEKCPGFPKAQQPILPTPKGT